jgi:hypothetical protein
MAESNQPDDKLREEAEKYVDSLPGETAEGRMTDDTGAPADTEAWEAESARQQATLRGNKPADTDPE